MIKKIFIAALLFMAFAATGQKLQFEALDSIADSVNRLELAVNNQSYQTDANYTVSFTEQPFSLYSYNHLADKAWYISDGKRELLYLAESIDFSKATGIESIDLSTDIIAIRLHFPAGILKTEVYENGVALAKPAPDYVDFFVSARYDKEAKVFPSDGMFFTMYDLCMAMRLGKGLVKAEAANAEMEDYAALPAADFIAKYPTSILVMQARKNMAHHDQLMRTAQIWLDDFCKAYYFIPGSTPDQVAASNKAFAKAIKKESENFEEDGRMLQHYSNLLVKKAFYDTVYINFAPESGLYSIMYQTVWERNGTYSWIISQLREHVPSALVMQDKGNTLFKVRSPDGKYIIAAFDDTLLFKVSNP